MKLGSRVVEESKAIVPTVTSPPFVRVIAPSAKEAMCVKEIENMNVLQVPTVTVLSLNARFVLPAPSAVVSGTRLPLLALTVSTPVVTPLSASLANMGSCVRREPSEIVHQGQHVVEVLPVTAPLGTTLMVEGVLVNRVN